MNRCYHRVRRSGGKEAILEGWISQLKYLWNPIHGPSTGTLCGRLHLRLAGLRGSGAPAEEKFAQLVADVLLGPAGKFARVAKQSKALATFRQHAENSEANRHLQNIMASFDLKKQKAHLASGRARTASIKIARAKYTPIGMEADLQSFLQSHKSSFRLPLYAKTNAQWEKDRVCDTRGSQRAQDWARQKAKAASSKQVPKLFSKPSLKQVRKAAAKKKSKMLRA